jgi:cell division control protein 6
MISSYKDLKRFIEEEGTIFLNSDVFNLDYVPDTYPFRDEQLNQMASYSKDITHGKAPKTMLLKGGYATGKTSTLKNFFKLLNQGFPNVICVYVHCQFINTEHEILIEIFNHIFDFNAKSGTNTKYLFNKIIKKLKDDNIILVIGLDEYDSLKNSSELNKVLFKFLRVKEKFDNVEIGLIVVGSSVLALKLEDSVKTIFKRIPINFPTYSKQQLYYILKLRCQEGFYPGVISEDILLEVVQRTYDEGNLRYGILLLGAAGNNAERENSNKILKKHLNLL